MQGFLTVVGATLGAILVLAITVASWEHLRAATLQALPIQPVRAWPVRVDIDLDALAEPPAPLGDGALRRAALEETLDRIAREQDSAAAPLSALPKAWPDTAPMVACGTPAVARDTSSLTES
jgi:hypothetical protein